MWQSLIPPSAHVSLPYRRLLPQLLLSHSPNHTGFDVVLLLIKPPFFFSFFFFTPNQPLLLTFIHSSPFSLFHRLILFFFSFLLLSSHRRLDAASPLTPHNEPSSSRSRRPLLVTLRLSCFTICTRQTGVFSALPRPDIQSEWPLCCHSIIQHDITFDFEQITDLFR